MIDNQRVLSSQNEPTTKTLPTFLVLLVLTLTKIGLKVRNAIRGQIIREIKQNDNGNDDAGEITAHAHAHTFFHYTHFRDVSKKQHCKNSCKVSQYLTHFAYDDSSSGMRKYIRFTYIWKIEDHGSYEFDVDNNDREASDPSC